MIEQKYIDMILDQVDIVNVIGDYIGESNLIRKGRRYWACCPFHSENTPSFCIDENKGTWHCFGKCQEGGNVIGFVMKHEGLPFPLAVKRLLKDYLNIDTQNVEVTMTADEEEKQKKKESMFAINEYLCRWFVERIHGSNPDEKAARDYSVNRWGKDYIEESGVGYAPDSWNILVDWAKSKALDLELMKEMGIIKDGEKTGQPYSVYRNRIMIPIRDKYSRIIGFTGRTMDEHDSRKYMNSSDCDIYHKQDSLFGIDVASRQARKEEKMYLVEGGPDVMKLHSIGILNTVACLGGNWTNGQMEMLKRLHAKLCFIPDSDNDKPEGERPGENYVMKNGAMAMNMGLIVSVKEIPNDTCKKMDPDSYITDKAVFAGMNEEEFVLWYARKKWDDDATTEDRLKLVNEICDLVVGIPDETTQESYITQLSALYSARHEWMTGYRAAKRRRIDSYSKSNKANGGIDMLHEYGFFEKRNRYYGVTKDGKEVLWSNFKMKPLFHIKDDQSPVRLFEINNDDDDDPSEMIELDMDVFTSSRGLRKKLLGVGNYTWLADDNALIQLQRYLAKVTESAVQIKQLGWNRKGFYCFCNGALEDDTWVPADKMGIIRLKCGKFYSPAVSKIYSDNTEKYVNERRFRHITYSNIKLHDYFQKVIDVFGDNGKIALCFYLATLYKDLIKPKARCFPLLNIYGIPNTGKTALAKLLTGFFLADPKEPANLETGSLPSMADEVSDVSNAIVHFDEFKNGIAIKRIEWLKDIWGGAGRQKMNMDKDKKREQARVDAGVVITGQEIPTADIALFTRLIFLGFTTDSHTIEQKHKFDSLMSIKDMGTTHITIEILKHRQKFEASFGNAWKKASTDMNFYLKDKFIIDRIETNWTIPLAALLALDGAIDPPFTYNEMLDICVNGVIKQNEMCKRMNDVADFWNIISSAQQKGIVVYGQDFIIKTKTEFKTNTKKDGYVWEIPKRILMIRKNIMMATYRQLGKQMDKHILPDSSMENYLQTSNEYIGNALNVERFKKFMPNGLCEQKPIYKDGVMTGQKTVWYQDRPMCFDYDAVSTKYGIILDSFVEEYESEPEKEHEDGKQLMIPYEDVDEDSNVTLPY